VGDGNTWGDQDACIAFKKRSPNWLACLVLYISLSKAYAKLHSLCWSFINLSTGHMLADPARQLEVKLKARLTVFDWRVQ
jgi:hypothetical protein